MRATRSPSDGGVPWVGIGIGGIPWVVGKLRGVLQLAALRAALVAIALVIIYELAIHHFLQPPHLQPSVDGCRGFRPQFWTSSPRDLLG